MSFGRLFLVTMILTGASPLMLSWTLACLTAGGVLAIVLLLVRSARRQQRNYQRREEQFRQREKELQMLLALQERKVKQLTAFAEQMQESEAGTRAIIDNALDGVITIDHNGRIIEFNPAAEQLFGHEREAILGKSIAETIVPPSLREAHQRGMAHFLATGEGPLLGKRVETFGWHADGYEFPMELAITVLHPQQPPLLTAYVHDLTQLRQTTEMLTRSNGRLQAVLEAATQIAIIVTDADGLITLFNRGAERMLGYRAEEVVGRATPKKLLLDDELTAHSRRLSEEFGSTLEGFAALVERARRDDHEEREWTFARKDGSCLTVNLAVTVIRDDAGQISGYLAVATDVTSRRRAALALQRAKEAAEAASRAKSDFLANMSHEIRTPMNGILGMTQLALDTDLTPDQREYLQLVKTSADGLLNVINDILDFSKIEAGKLELAPVEFELRDTLADTLRSLSLRASARHLELACHVPADVPDFLVGDPLRLRQILLNLVGNAIKFTETGEVVVRVRGTADTNQALAALTPGGAIELHFSVTDTGIGIAPDMLAAIFDPFVQADSSTTRKYGGTGLGLSITSRLVEMMGGRLWAESVPDQGSTFHFTLRLRLQDRSPSKLLPRRPLDLQGLAVLVVDDNATNRRIMDELLSSWLLKPCCVAGVPQALTELEAAAIEKKPFPLVLLDAHMPGEDGFALAAAIRARPHLGQPQLILLTSGNRAEDGPRCRALGIGQSLTKPVKPSHLLKAIVNAFLQGTDAATSAAPALVAQEPSRGTLVAVNEGAEQSTALPCLRVLLAEDNLVNQRLMLAVLEKKGHSVVAVPNGAAAVRAVQQEPFDVVLMDVQMPEMNGLEATRAIRLWEQQQGGHLPIIAMTAHAMKGAREDCLRAGMDHYLSKPIQMSELERLLNDVPCQHGHRPIDAAASKPPVFDPRPLLERINGDGVLFRELAAMYEEDCPRLLAELREALAGNDADALERSAHRLKGAVANFAATEAVQAAQRLETLGCSGDLSSGADAYRALEEALSVFQTALAEWLAAHPVETAGAAV